MFFVLFKQETAYEMRISDWSSDVCSSDLCERTLSGLCALLQENRLRQALAPYVLGGPHGRLLDAECESLGEGEVRAFEMEQLMHARGAVLPVLTYLFHRLERRFDGAPTLLVLEIGRAHV